MSAGIPTFGPRRAQVSPETSGARDELVRGFWTFLKGIETQRIRIIEAGGLNGDLLKIGSDGFIIASNSLNGDYTFTSSVTINGSDLSVLVDALSLVSRAPEDLLIGTDLLAGFPVFAGNDAPAVASARLGKVDLTAQTANIASTALSNTPPAGFYEVEVYLETTTADATAGTLAVVIGWTDDVGATTSTVITAHSLAATGRTTGRALARVASGNLTYSVTVTGIYATAAYAVFARVVALG